MSLFVFFFLFNLFLFQTVFEVLYNLLDAHTLVTPGLGTHIGRIWCFIIFLVLNFVNICLIY